jgi:hypothetical protein
MSTSNSSSVTSGNRGTIAHLNSANSTCGMFRFAAVTDNVGTEIQFHTRPAAGSLTQTMTLDSAGRLGIGTTAPSALLHLGVASATVDGTKGVRIANPGGTVAMFECGVSSDSYIGTLSASDFSIRTNNAPRISVTNAGNVGIGTSSVDFSDFGSNTGGVAIQDIGSTNTGLKIGDGSNDNYLVAAGNGSFYQNHYGSGSMIFGVGNGTGTERMRIDSSGRLLVGTSTARDKFFNTTYAPVLQIEGTTYPTSMSSIVANGVVEPYLIFGRTRAGSIGGTTVVNSGDACGAVSFQGSDGTELVEAASIAALVDGTPGANDMPGRLVFSTTADGASSPTERMRIDSTGYIRAVGTSSTARIIPNTDNVGYLGQSSERWQAVYAVNGTIQTSDRRQKTDITEALLGSDFVKTLKPVSYKWIEGGKEPTGEIDENEDRVFTSIPGQRTHWGFIAQDVKEAVDAAGVDFGGWLLDDKDDPDSQQALRYDQFIAPLTKALQEALAEIDVLKAKVAALEAS